MPFRSKLQVTHDGGKDWILSAPLVYEGKFDWFVVGSGFRTDFASIPRPLRWLLDNAARNSEAAVLHDVLWRSNGEGDQRVDPWNVDAMFRRALRETGSTSVARGVMWAAVRIAAVFKGRFGSPTHIGRGKRILSWLLMALIGLITVGVPTVVALGGLLFYWLVSWLCAATWWIFYERRRADADTNWPWPFNDQRPEHKDDATQYLRVIPKSAPEATILDQHLDANDPPLLMPTALAALLPETANQLP